MKREHTLRMAASWLMAVFLFFYVGNTTFVHVHSVAGGNIVHSHPYFPGKCHSHTAQELAGIAQANFFAGTMEYTDIQVVAAPEVSAPMVEADARVLCVSRTVMTVSGRAPPAGLECTV